jgi:hypothetical protein
MLVKRPVRWLAKSALGSIEAAGIRQHFHGGLPDAHASER